MLFGPPLLLDHCPSHNPLYAVFHCAYAPAARCSRLDVRKLMVWAPFYCRTHNHVQCWLLMLGFHCTRKQWLCLCSDTAAANATQVVCSAACGSQRICGRLLHSLRTLTVLSVGSSMHAQGHPHASSRNHACGLWGTSAQHRRKHRNATPGSVLKH